MALCVRACMRACVQPRFFAYVCVSCGSHPLSLSLCVCVCVSVCVPVPCRKALIPPWLCDLFIISSLSWVGADENTGLSDFHLHIWRSACTMHVESGDFTVLCVCVCVCVCVFVGG